MPRKLPWGTQPKPKPISRLSPPPKRQRTSPPTCTPQHAEEQEQEDLSKPTYMRHSDECYIMVEDEFLSIAQTYTRSLHRAEYERLQLQAKTKNARRISEIQRPVAGVTRMSKETLLPSKHEDTDTTAARSIWGNSSLGMLMCSPKKRERDLSARWRITSGTRAAAGFEKSEVVVKRRSAPRAAEKYKSELDDVQKGVCKPVLVKSETVSSTETETEDEDDDLDTPVIRQGQVSQASMPISRSQSFPSSSQRSQGVYRRPTAPASLMAPSSPAGSSQSVAPLSSPPQVVKKEIPDFDFGLELVASQRSVAYRGRSMAARKQAERQKEGPVVGDSMGRVGLLGALFPKE